MKREDWIIEAENLCYTYEGNEEKALNGIDLKIRRGRKVAFLGGNGSGKSTFFLCLNGIRKPDQGRILIDGEPVKYTRKGLLEVRRKVGIVFQEPDDQLFSASVYQEISFGILNLGADEKTAEREVNRVIEELGITPFRETIPTLGLIPTTPQAMDGITMLPCVSVPIALWQNPAATAMQEPELEPPGDSDGSMGLMP